MSFIVVLWLFGSVFIPQGSSAPVNNAVKHLPGASKFWHISDLHLDPTYHVTEDHTKVCFSSKGFPALDPGKFGDFLCDSPYELILSAFTFMKHVDLQPDFIIWTGDSPPHVPKEKLSTALVVSVIANMTHTIRRFFPDVPVYPALGNHDYWPQDQLPTSPNAIYDAVGDLWSDWLDTSAVATLRKGGFYSLLVRPGLRLVSVNTNLYYGPNAVTEEMSDPAGQFQWLEDTLETSRQSLEKVYVIAHVPVGFLPFARNTTAIRERHNQRLVEMFRRYAEVIQGQFYGHTHRDSIMVLLDRQGNPVNSLFVTPAVTPIRSSSELYSNNPGLRAYLYSPHDYKLLDIWQYFLNLTEANLEGQTAWKLEYVMTEAFDMVDIQPHSLHRLARSMEQPRSKAFRKYFQHYMVSYDPNLVCEADCKSVQVCSVLCLDRESYSQCIAGSD